MAAAEMSLAALAAQVAPPPDEPAPGAAPPAAADDAAYDAPYREFRDGWLERGERAYLERLLERHGRQMNVCAQAAGVDRTYLYRLLRKHGL